MTSENSLVNKIFLFLFSFFFFVLINIAYALPVASINAPEVILAGDAVSLSALNSSGNQLKYRWRIVERPEGSNAQLVNGAESESSFVADRAGIYLAELRVLEGAQWSAPKYHTISSVVTNGEIVLTEEEYEPSFFCQLSFGLLDCEEVIKNFNVANPNGYFSVVIENEGVKKAFLSLNGNDLTDYYQLSGNTEVAVKRTLLQAQNQLKLRFGRPGSFGEFNSKLKIKIVRNIAPSGINAAPVASAPNILYYGSVGGQTQLTINDPDQPTGHKLSILVPAKNGEVSITSDGVVKYEPDFFFSGDDEVVVLVKDSGVPQKAYAVVIPIILQSGNEAPILAYTFPSFTNGQTVSGKIVVKDSSDQNHTYSILDQPINGTVVVSGEGSFSFTPNSNYIGFDSFKIRVSDDGTPSASTDVIIPIEVLENHNPSISAPILEIEQGMTGAIKFSFHDNDEGQEVSIGIKTLPANGMATMNTDGTLIYTPDPSYYGEDVVEIVVSDNGNPSKETLLLYPITVFENKTPIIKVTDNPFTASPGIRRSFNYFIDDYNRFQTHSVQISQQPQHGTVVFEDGRFYYTADAGFIGQDEFILSATDNGFPVKTGFDVVRVNVEANRPPAPVFEGPTVLSDKEGTFFVYPNDPDSNQKHSFSISQQPSHGVLIPLSYWPFAFKFIPENGYRGSDQFKIVVSDNGTPIMSGEVVVNLTLRENRAPVIYSVSPIKLAQMATAYSWVNAKDPDNDQITVKVLETSTLGRLQVYNDSIQFYANQGISGTETLTVEVSDNGNPKLSTTTQLLIEVEANRPPTIPNYNYTTSKNRALQVIVRADDPDQGQIATYSIVSQPSHGTVEAIHDSGAYKYTPNSDYLGNDEFFIRVTDNGNPALSAQTKISIQVENNFPPQPVANSIKIFENAGTAVSRINPNDPNVNQGHTYGFTIYPVNGVASVDSSGAFFYTVNPHFHGQDQAIISVTDNGSPALSGAVVIPIEVEKNLPPNPIANNITIFQGRQGSIVISPNDPNTIEQSFSYKITKFPANGIITNNFPPYTYFPALGFSGQDSIEIEVMDSGGLAARKTVGITVVKNSDPVVIANNFTTFQSTASSTQINFTDVEPDQGHTYSIKTMPVHGTASISFSGLLMYRPFDGYSGDDFITVQVKDNAIPNGVGEKQIQVTVVPNVTPTVIANNITTFQSTTATGQISFTDPEVDQSHFYLIDTQPSHGVASINSSGLLTYSPHVGYSGVDTVTVGVRDSAIPPAIGKKEIQITVVANTAPTVIAQDIAIFQGGSGTTQVSFTDPDLGQDHTYQIIQYPSNGSANITSQGVLTYSSGGQCNTSNDVVKVGVADNANPPAIGEKEIRVLVTANTSPMANIDDFNIRQRDTMAKQIVVVDPDVGQTHRFSITRQALDGNAYVNEAGLVTYMHLGVIPGGVAQDSFEIEVTDNFSGCGTQSFRKNVLVNISPNSTPVLAISNVVVEQGAFVEFTATATDADPSQTLRFTWSTNPANGFVSVNPETGVYRYNPLPNFSGNDQFTAKVYDDGTPILFDEKIVNVTVVPLNFPPAPTVAPMSLLSGKTSTTTIFANDPDVSQTHTFEIISPNQFGWASVNNQGVLTYHAFEGTEGNEVIQVKVTDNGIFPRNAIVNVPVEVVRNLAPNPADQSVADAVSGMSVQLTVAHNDPNHARFPQVYTYEISNEPEYGSASVNFEGKVTYVAPVGFVGVVEFDVKVTDQGTPQLDGDAHITINVLANSAPVVAGANLNTVKNVGAQKQIAFTDANSVRQTFTYSIAQQPTHGAATVSTTGLVYYVPQNDYIGQDEMIVRVTDSGNPALSGVAIYTINVSDSENTPPSLDEIEFFTASNDYPKKYDFYLSGLRDDEGAVSEVRVNFGDGSELFVLNVNSPAVLSGTMKLKEFDHYYRQSGSYQVTIVAIDNEGAQSQFTTTVQVGTNLAPVARINYSPMQGNVPLNLTADASLSSDSDGIIAQFCLDLIKNNQEVFSQCVQNGLQISYQLADEGVYLARGCVTDNGGAYHCTTQNIYAGVEAPVAGAYKSVAIIDASQRVGTAPLNNVTLSAARSTGLNGANIVEYQWAIRGRIANGAGQKYEKFYSGVNQSVNFPYSGAYDVALYVIDANGNIGETSTQVYAESNVLDAISIFAVYYGDNSFQFKTNTVGLNISANKIFWDLGDGQAKKGYEAFATLESGKIHQIKVEAYDHTGKKYTATKVVDLTVTPTAPNISIANIPSQVQQNQAFSIDAIGTTDPNGPLRYRWWMGDGTPQINGVGASFAQISHTYTTLGEKTARLIVTNNQGLSSEFEMKINVVTGSVPSLAGSVSPLSGLSPLIVSAQAQATGSVLGYTWNFDSHGRGRIKTGQYASNTYYSSGEYYVSVTALDSNGNTFTELVDMVEVGSFNKAPIVVAENLSTPQNQKLIHDVEFNDDDDVAQLHSFSIVVAPSHGTATISSSGRIVYQPQANYIGSDSLRVRVTDSSSISAYGEATFNIQVTGDNNINPVIAGLGYTYETSSYPRKTFIYFEELNDPDGEIVKVTWNFGDGTSPVVIESNQLDNYDEVVHQYLLAGTYTATMTAEDNQGGVTTETISIVLAANQLPIPTFNISKTGSGPYQVTLDASSAVDTDGSIEKYCWDVTSYDNEVFSECTVDAITTITVNDSTDLLVSLYVQDNGNGGAYYETNYSFNGYSKFPPYVALETTGNRRGNAPMTLQWNSQQTTGLQNKAITRRFWQTSDWQLTGAYFEGNNATAEYLFPGTHITKLFAVDSNGETGTAEKMVYVGQNVGLVADFTAKSDDGESVVFNAADWSHGHMAGFYLWDFGDGTYGYDRWAGHTYNKSGSYKVSLMVLDIYGNVDSVEQVIRVGGDTPSANLNAFRYHGQLNTSIPLQVTGNGNDIVRWNFGDGTFDQGEISEKGSISKVYSQRGIYRLRATVTSEDSGLSRDFYSFVTVTDNIPNPNLSIITSQNNGPAPMFVNFSLGYAPTYVPTAYRWVIKNDHGEIINMSTQSTMSYQFNRGGNYSVEMVIRDAAGNRDYATYGIFVSDNFHKTKKVNAKYFLEKSSKRRMHELELLKKLHTREK